jgi:hypothetical protein
MSRGMVASQEDRDHEANDPDDSLFQGDKEGEPDEDPSCELDDRHDQVDRVICPVDQTVERPAELVEIRVALGETNDSKRGEEPQPEENDSPRF